MTELINITFNACPSNLRRVRGLVREQVAAQGVDAELTHQLTLVIDEACANVMRHGYHGNREGRMKLRLRNSAPGVLEFQLRDYAAPVDPAGIKPRDLDECRPGGLGINFIDTVMDSWQFRPPRSGLGNVLEMSKAIGGNSDDG